MLNQTVKGWVIAIAAFGMMCGLLAVDVTQLKSMHEVTTPLFIGNFMAHLAIVIAAFIGGKLIPTARDVWTDEQRAANIKKG